MILHHATIIIWVIYVLSYIIISTEYNRKYNGKVGIIGFIIRTLLSLVFTIIIIGATKGLDELMYRLHLID